MFALKSSGDPEAYWPNSNFSRGTQSDGGLPRVEAGVAPARCAVAIKWHDPIGPIMLFSLPYCLVRLSRNSSNRSRRSSGSLSGHFRTHAPQQQNAHSITSSASCWRCPGTSTPIAVAVLRLITRSNLSGRCIGKSLGLAPCRTLATYSPHLRNMSVTFGP